MTPRYPRGAIPRRRPAVRGPTAGATAVVLGLLGAAAYFGSVLFVISEEAGPRNAADALAEKIALGAGLALCLVGLVLALVGLKTRPRGAAIFGLTLCLAFVAFAALSLVGALRA